MFLCRHVRRHVGTDIATQIQVGMCAGVWTLLSRLVSGRLVARRPPAEGGEGVGTVVVMVM